MYNGVPDIVLFLGRFHPLVVHLPIGFLFFAFVLEVFSRWKKNSLLTTGIPLALFLGGVSGAVACILGYMLSLSGDYEQGALDTHFWLGIATTAIAFLAWLIRIEKIKSSYIHKLKPNISALTLLVILLSVTGHYGGNLTHGSDYLVKYMPFGKKEKTELVAVHALEDAEVYGHLVAPILENKCASCHNSSKKKGGLAITDSISIVNGGKNGEVILPGNAMNSELLKRVLLDPHDENFMPPEGKTPLTEEEIEVLTYWIDNANAEFSTKVAQVETPETITTIGNTLLGLEAGSASNNLPTVGEIDITVLNELQKSGFRLRELSFESGLYEVILPAQTTKIGEGNKMLDQLNSLLKIKENVIWLSIEDNQVTEEHSKIISQLVNLRKLKLNKNPLTDAAVTHLISLPSLEVLNLFGTQITAKSLESFSKMKQLKYAYVWQTNITKDDLVILSEEDISKVIIN